MNPTVGPRSAQPARSLAEPTDFVSAELRRYDDHLRDVRGLAAGTRRNHFRIVGLLLRRKFAGGVVATATLRPLDVRRFIARQLGDNPSHSAAAQVATALRSYLRYRTICGDSVNRCHRPRNGAVERGKSIVHTLTTQSRVAWRSAANISSTTTGSALHSSPNGKSLTSVAATALKSRPVSSHHRCIASRREARLLSSMWRVIWETSTSFGHAF